MDHLRPYFLLTSIQQLVVYMFLIKLTGFELQSSGIVNNHSANWATPLPTRGQSYKCFTIVIFDVTVTLTANYLQYDSRFIIYDFRKGKVCPIILLWAKSNKHYCLLRPATYLFTATSDFIKRTYKSLSTLLSLSNPTFRWSLTVHTKKWFLPPPP